MLDEAAVMDRLVKFWPKMESEDLKLICRALRSHTTEQLIRAIEEHRCSDRGSYRPLVADLRKHLPAIDQPVRTAQHRPPADAWREHLLRVSKLPPETSTAELLLVEARKYYFARKRAMGDGPLTEQQQDALIRYEQMIRTKLRFDLANQTPLDAQNAQSVASYVNANAEQYENILEWLRDFARQQAGEAVGDRQMEMA